MKPPMPPSLRDLQRHRQTTTNATSTSIMSTSPAASRASASSSLAETVVSGLASYRNVLHKEPR